MPEATSSKQHLASVDVPFGLLSILLVESDVELRDSRRLLLSILNHPVLALPSYADVCKLPNDNNCCLVAIDTRPSSSDAARTAMHVRRYWPKAKILLLGPPPPHFEDQLYDDAVDACCNPSEVVSTARRLLRNDFVMIRDRSPAE